MSAPVDTSSPDGELFELELHGGAPELRFREERPHADAMPWGTLDLSSLSEDELVAARRGWTDLALQEYAAAASQSNALRLVIRARTPLDLSAWLATFPLDELAHTDICARMASELGGAVPLQYGAEDVFPEPSPHEGSPVFQAARAVAREFCVGENVSHGLLLSHHKHAQDPLLQAVWGRLARDEAAHASFGWVFMRWALPMLSASERAEIAATIERAVRDVNALEDKIASEPAEAFCRAGVYGARGRERYVAEQRAAIDKRVMRRARTLLSVG